MNSKTVRACRGPSQIQDRQNTSTEKRKQTLVLNPNQEANSIDTANKGFSPLESHWVY